MLFSSSDSTTIENGIYDGYDNITRGLVNYAIYDDSCSSIVGFVTKEVLNGSAGLAEESSSIKIWQASNELHLFVESEMDIQILDLTGKVLMEKTIEQGETAFQINFPAGIYMLSNQNENRQKFYCGI